MEVFSLKRKGRNVFVEISNNEILKVPYDFFVNNYLSKNQKLTKAQYQKYKKEVELYKIKQNAFRFLSGRNHSRFELKQKLIKKKYSSDLIDIVLDEFTNKNYLNDEIFANQFFINQVKRNRGLIRVKAELYKKGVDREIIEKIARENSNTEDFLHSAELLANKKIKSLEHKSLEKNKLKQKVYQFLAGRGYTPDIINTTIKKCIK